MLYAKNEKHKIVASDWTYCLKCFPFSVSYPWFEYAIGWQRISWEEYNKLLSQGYEEDDY